jgi:hypothetical protein
MTPNSVSSEPAAGQSPNTHRNSAAMNQRDVLFGRHSIRCEWHLKIQPHRDRVHFMFGHQSVDPSKILVGIFAEHLPV